MFVLNNANENGTRTAFNIEEAPTFSVDVENKLIYVGSQKLLDASADEKTTGESLIKRYNDILVAYASNAKVYDLDRAVGHWKPKQKSEEKPAPKPAPKKDA